MFWLQRVLFVSKGSFQTRGFCKVSGKMKLISENCYKFLNEKAGIDIHVYLSPNLYEDFAEDQSINQLYNTSTSARGSQSNYRYA